MPLCGAEGVAEFLDATAADGSAGGGRRAKAVAGDLFVGVRVLEILLVHQTVEEALVAIEHVIREIEATEPWIVVRKLFGHAKLLDELVFGRPIQAIGGAERIALKIEKDLLPCLGDGAPILV